MQKRAKHTQHGAKTEGKTDGNSKEKHNVEGVSGKVGPPDGKWLPQGGLPLSQPIGPGRTGSETTGTRRTRNVFSYLSVFQCY